MGRISLLSTVAVVALSSVAMAADLPSRKAPEVYAPVAAVPVFTWTGLYLGVNAGVAFGQSTAFTDVNGYNALGASTSVDRGASFTGGVTGGYNLQFGSIVAGIEADANYIDYGGSAVAALSPGGDTVYRTRGNFLATVRGRLGFAWDRFMIYGTGGAAFTDLKYSVLDACVAAPCGPGTISGSTSMDTTWTVGGGVEYAFSNNWTGKAEYLYVDLPGRTFTGVTGGGAPFNFRTNHSGVSLVRVGLNYKF
jgi:outer membrane immunogenic protein